MLWLGFYFRRRVIVTNLKLCTIQLISITPVFQRQILFLRKLVSMKSQTLEHWTSHPRTPHFWTTPSPFRTALIPQCIKLLHKYLCRKCVSQHFWALRYGALSSFTPLFKIVIWFNSVYIWKEDFRCKLNIIPHWKITIVSFLNIEVHAIMNLDLNRVNILRVVKFSRWKLNLSLKELFNIYASVYPWCTFDMLIKYIK